VTLTFLKNNCHVQVIPVTMLGKTRWNNKLYTLALSKDKIGSIEDERTNWRIKDRWSHYSYYKRWSQVSFNNCFESVFKNKLGLKKGKNWWFFIIYSFDFWHANVKITKFKCTFPVVSDFFIKINIFLVNFFF